MSRRIRESFGNVSIEETIGESISQLLKELFIEKLEFEKFLEREKALNEPVGVKIC